jgi:hypothetical protein
MGCVVLCGVMFLFISNAVRSELTTQHTLAEFYGDDIQMIKHGRSKMEERRDDPMYNVSWHLHSVDSDGGKIGNHNLFFIIL